MINYTPKPRGFPLDVITLLFDIIVATQGGLYKGKMKLKVVLSTIMTSLVAASEC